MAKKDLLKVYKQKRDFNITSEPSGGRSKGKKKIFVIQKHDATAMHYDFRIEVNGVLKSWAVPKGPSTNPKDRRLAVPTEDHPMDYAGFEGTIPEHEYGGGTVMVWDTGTYKNITKKDGKTIPITKAINEGRFSIWLEGEKVKGGYTFINANVKEGKERWYLIKLKDDEADPEYDLVKAKADSVISGRSLEEISKSARKK
jgi:DNA ligase D-like protein (predicted 3'-phosphoesterase)